MGSAMTTALEESTEHQLRARMALTAALASGPSHAYLFRGPRGAGKAAAARAFAAEILAAAATDDPDDARRRALLDPSPHPDLVWLRPAGSQHMVEEVRERVIRAAAYRPFEGGKRVFVVETAEAMRDESQNALLKTLEEPGEFVHVLLLASEPAALLETIASRCQPVDFSPLPTSAIEAALAGSGDSDEIAAAARLSAGDLSRAQLLLSEEGKRLRASAFALGAVGVGSADTQPARASADPTPTAPWQSLLKSAESAGTDAEEETRELLEEEKSSGIKRSARDISDAAKRAGRRRRTEILDLGLELCVAWYRDLAVAATGAVEIVFNRDRLPELQAQAAGLDPTRPRRAAELVQETRRRLELNVSEELALEALVFRVQRLFG